MSLHCPEVDVPSAFVRYTVEPAGGTVVADQLVHYAHEAVMVRCFVRH